MYRFWSTFVTASRHWNSAQGSGVVVSRDKGNSGKALGVITRARGVEKKQKGKTSLTVCEST